MERFSDFELLPEPILVHQDGRWIYANAAALKLLGARTADELVGRPIIESIHPDYRGVVMHRVENASTGGVNRSLEQRMLRVDGSAIDVEVVGLPVKIGEGRGVLIHLRDVTERKRTAEALRQSEERFRATFEQAAVGIAHIGLDGRWLMVNQRLAEIVGYAHDELLELDFQQITHPDDLRVDLNYVAQLVGGHVVTYAMDKRFIHKEGRPVWVRLTASLVRDADGAPAYIIAVVEDIDAKKAAEEALRRSESRFRELLENGGDLIVIVGPSGFATYRSPSIERMLGYDSTSLGAVPFIEHVHPEDRATVAEAFAKLIAEPRATQIVTARFRHANGEWRLLEAIGTNLLDRPEIRGIVINARDITERRHLEEQVEQTKRVESLGRVAATVVHEFNNVLMGIQPLARAIERSYKNDESLQRLAQLILKAVGRGKQISAGILRFARPAQPLTSRLAVRPWLESLVEEFVAQRGIEVALSVDEALPDVLADAAQLEQVLMNLLLNARDAMPHGGRITVEARHLDHATDAIALSVTDQGTGMTEDVAQKIFEPLFTTKRHGTGLGLAVSYQIVKRHGGQLNVRTEPGEGSTFEIVLPAADAGA